MHQTIAKIFHLLGIDDSIPAMVQIDPQSETRLWLLTGHQSVKVEVVEGTIPSVRIVDSNSAILWEGVVEAAHAEGQTQSALSRIFRDNLRSAVAAAAQIPGDKISA